MGINKAINSRFFLATLLLCFLGLGSAATGKTIFEKAVSLTVNQKALRVFEFKIQKLSCATCAKEIVQELGRLSGISYARIELDLPWDASSFVIYNPKKLKNQAVLDLVHKHMYYEAEVKDRACTEADLKCLAKPGAKPQPH
jgi:copper chaperone CopZ